MTTISIPALPQSNAEQQTAALKTANNKKAVHKAAVQFESMFMNEMLGHMFSGIKGDGPFNGGHGEKVFQSMMVEQYGHIVANSGQTGISASIEKEMLRMQEEQSKPRQSA